LASSALAFGLVGGGGAAYLIYLGIRRISTRNAAQGSLDAQPAPRRSPVFEGMLTEVLNFKTALFFLSLIPQFVTVTHAPEVAQFLILGTFSVTLNTSAEIVATLFARPGTRLERPALFRRRQRTGPGVAMIALGVYVSTADSR
jgi:threonine/homoserine/homoserine lactone efflux protein